MKDIGDLHYYLGIEILKESGKTHINQHKNTREILRRFNMSECKAVSTPLEKNVK